MNERKKAVMNWSGGKDSALALYKTLQQNEYDVVSLLTTINQDTQLTSIHAIPLPILKKQAAAIGIPLFTVALSKTGNNYEAGMTEAIVHFKQLGVTHFIFGDIFLADVKAYREEKFNPLGIEIVEPLWGQSSCQIFNEFLQSGIKTKIIVTQADKLDESFIGVPIDNQFAALLPPDIDLCGENGEYHSFCYDGPIFKTGIEFELTGPQKISYEFKMDTGEMKSFDYWQASILSK